MFSHSDVHDIRFGIQGFRIFGFSVWVPSMSDFGFRRVGYRDWREGVSNQAIVLRMGVS